ncbi:Hsp33 family molecular chaperone HslO [uncultured Phascolarctobacterium sp.]|jgi:molecular chaperone Hsp33|uniref:Hsp33 family molecular chaperone HslO n=1 Tax=uncultured Phascolarctobacterium sp. TaxID=512296 RepID=UPI0015AC9683|nr:Hsp33 family molecular chaperone HslO [uncultured Phascolarctobacterium sp.]MDO5379701.1 Hsp33 family molecular chaperone HslO [Acidaminococcaceae bacterium]
MKDILTKGTAEGVRIYALCTTNLVQEAAARHHTSHLASAALGRAMNGALLLAATMKDNERITLRLKGDGPIGEVVADAEGTNVRGYVGDPDVFLPLKNGKLDVGGALGAGNIIVTRYLQNAEPFTGYAELVDGEIASDLTNYLYTSEQTPSSVALGVLVNKEGQVIASGGYFIQAMPGCAEETLAKLEENISLTPYVTQLLELGYTPEKMIETIARGLEVTIQESVELSYKCRCSREKILGALATLGQEDLTAMSEDEETEVHCQFCNETYKFSGAEIAGLLKK